MALEDPDLALVQALQTGEDRALEVLMADTRKRSSVLSFASFPTKLTPLN